jgi:hypothetical protein
MKKLFIIFIVAAFVSLNLDALSQPPPPPTNASASGSTPPVGGSAPVGSGISLLISLAGLYGGKKLYKAKQESRKNE